MKITKVKEAVKGFFNDARGRPMTLSDGQVEIFNAVYDPSITRATIKAVTQYGKSDVASMALIMAMMNRVEKILIVAPRAEQAKIIMSYIIRHIFDHELFIKSIEYEGSLERLRQERSKSRITMRNGSEVFILTANAKEVAKEAKSLMGFGADFVVVDESSLIPDKMYSKILRMVGGVKNGKIVQLGNPFEKNHFYRAFTRDRYHKISIEYKQALAEGRISQEFIDEAQEDMDSLDWKIFYECEFPDQGAEDTLIPLEWIENAVGQGGCEGDHKQSGLDVARFGKDSTVYIFRKGGEVKRLETIAKMDTMEVTGWTNGFLCQDKPDAHCTDVIGIGSGVHDRLEELQGEKDDWPDTELLPINVGAGPTDKDDKEKFYNLRAQIFWHLRSLFKPDKNGKSQISIPNDGELKRELAEIRYKYSSEKKIKIEAKDEMKKRLGNSPDRADALALAFWDATVTEPVMFIADV